MKKNPVDKTALLIIDVQNDFCTGGALAVPDGEAVVPIINALSHQHFGITILTQDWHPINHSSFATNHPDAAPYSVIQADYGAQILWPTHCVQGEKGAAFHTELETNRADMIVRKGFRPAIDSYSAFFENDHTTPTGLSGYLRDRGIETVVCCGLATDFCVRYSALDAIRLGFVTLLVTDACRAIDLDGSLAAAMTEMQSQNVHMTQANTWTGTI